MSAKSCRKLCPVMIDTSIRKSTSLYFFSWMILWPLVRELLSFFGKPSRRMVYFVQFVLNHLTYVNSLCHNHFYCPRFRQTVNNYIKKAWNLIMLVPLIEAFELAHLTQNEQRRPTLMQTHTDTPMAYRCNIHNTMGIYRCNVLT